jgi:epoxyqueuosine reductase
MTSISERLRESLLADPNEFLGQSIRSYVLDSPSNRLKAFDDAPIYDEPLVGFADGDDSIFARYKDIIGEFHLTPREVLSKSLAETPGIVLAESSPVSVISFVLPFSQTVRLSNRKENKGPSLAWNHARWHGQDFIFGLSRHVVSLLQNAGYHAVAPELTSFFKWHDLPNGLASAWSQRHIAYATGLGTFGLSDGFITPRGVAMRCGSVVTDLKLRPTPRRYPDHHANCRFYAYGECARCMERCPGGAISEKGHDKRRCLEILVIDQKPWLDGAHGGGYIGQYAGCGLCQTDVPCEEGIPPAP